MIETIEPGTALAILPRASLPTILAADDKDIFGKLFAELKDFAGDVSTPKGRAEIASKARKVAVAKMDLIRLADGLKENAIKTQRAVNEEVKVVKEKMDALRDHVRAPLDEYEAREERRVATHEARLKTLEDGPLAAEHSTSAEIANDIGVFAELYAGVDWEEFAERANKVRTNTVNALRVAYQAAKTREDEAEAARLAAEEEAERQRLAAIEAQRLREEQIAAEAAAEATRRAREAAELEAQAAEERAQAALREAEERAQAERDAAAERGRLAARALADAAERERVAEERRVAAHETALSDLAALATEWPVEPTLRAMEIRLAQAHELAKRDWQEFAVGAATAHTVTVRMLEEQIATEQENIRVGNEIAEARRIENERVRDEARRAEAIEVERQRLAQEEAARKAEDDRRAADRAHRTKLNREIVADLMEHVEWPGGVAEALARNIVIALAKNEVRHVKVIY
jgi:colicin import membrane protein